VKSRRLRVNPIACEGHGLCAELLPERIKLDDWGYPIVDARPVSRELESHARRAVSACPTLALALVDDAELGAFADVRVPERRPR
jgi:ferredoxin